MSLPHILLADDEPDMLWALTHGLAADGYILHTASDGAAALEAVERIQPDMAILDVTMPQLDGLDVCRHIRQSPAQAGMNVLLLTACRESAQVIAGLDCGADDYVTKPFDLGELRARIRMLFRRSTQAGQDSGSNTHLLVVGDLTLNTHSHQLKVRDRLINITPIEYCLLRHLMRHPDEVFSTRDLLAKVLKYPRTDDPGIIRWHMKNLRSKIEPDAHCPTYLCTLPHHGYILRSKPEAD
jgi:DNA-binding response OmpR family regulator